MNNRIKELDFNNLLFVDIETVRGEGIFGPDHPHYNVWAWKQRDRKTNQIPPEKDVIDSYYNQAALHPEWGKIVCISVGYIKDKVLKTKSFVGEEKQILLDFVSLVKKTERMLVGYNLIQFDIPYIRKRFFINNLSDYITEKQGNDVYAKPWDLDASIFDLMVAWKGSGYITASLDEVAMCFGVKSSKDVMKGSEVSSTYYAGDIESIAKYCEEDVRVVAEILQCWKQEEDADFRRSEYPFS